MTERIMKTRALALLIAVSLGSVAQTASAENLLQVFQRAKVYDAQFKAQESNHLATLEKKQQALAGFKPQVSLSGSDSYNRSENNITNNTVSGDIQQYSLQLSQALFNKSLNATLGQANALISQSSETLEANRQDLIIRVSDAYFAALLAQDNQVFAAAEKTAIGRQLEQTNAYFEAGRSAITDVKEAEASYAAATAQEIAATQQLDVAREQLRVLTGGFYQSLNAPRDNMPLQVPAPASIESWVSMARQNNHSLKASQQAAQVARKTIDVQRGARYPVVNLTASRTHSNTPRALAGLGGSGDYRKDDSAVGVSLSVPLYSGGALSSKVREAQRNFEQAQQVQDYQTRLTEQQVRSAYLGVQSSISQVQANQQALAAAETAAEATQAGFEVGTRTAVDVLNSLRNVFKSRRDYSSARYDYLKTLFALRQAAGTLSEKDVAEISGFLTQPPLSADALSMDRPAADDTTLVAQQEPASAAKPGKPGRTPVTTPEAKPEAVEQAAPAPAEPAPADNGSYDYYVMPGQAK
jgi:outer membrane protein